MSSIVKHPVHFIGRANQDSPSAFIPFCDFGGDMSAMGTKVDQFDVPVCNSFQGKIYMINFVMKLILIDFQTKIILRRN